MGKRIAIRLSHRDILFENDDYIAVAKKRGWPVHRTLDARRPNLADALGSFLTHREHGARPYLALHHRLDVWTSGVVLFARSRRANPVLAKLFQERAVTKVYEALCVGAPPGDAGELVDFLKKKRVDGIERMVRVAAGGKKAITRYRLLERRGAFSHLELELVTGRMHQLRAQCALAGVPILGDRLYGSRELADAHQLEGQLLHARRLELDDPLSGQRLRIEAPTPDEFAAIDRPRAARAPRYLLFHKPYGVLSQFTRTSPDERTLADFDLPPAVYPVGRLDKDSEGLLLLTDDGAAKHRLAHPSEHTEKTYWVQVENVPSEQSLAQLRRGLRIRGHTTRPCEARVLGEVDLPPRTPPIRERRAIPTCWIEVVLTEGKNRQVRRMTAAIGHPTLRLVRVGIGRFQLGDLAPGASRNVPSF